MRTKLNELKNKEITLNDPIVYSESGVSHLAGCKGIMLNFQYGEEWEDIIVLGRMTDKYNRVEPIWFNAKDIKELKPKNIGILTK
jgi:hypothetical protein